MFNIFNHKGNAEDTALSFYPPSPDSGRMAISKQTNKNTCQPVLMMRKEEPLIGWKCKLVEPPRLLKSYNRTNIWLNYSTEGLRSRHHRDTCIPMFIAALFIAVTATSLDVQQWTKAWRNSGKYMHVILCSYEEKKWNHHICMKIHAHLHEASHNNYAK